MRLRAGAVLAAGVLFAAGAGADDAARQERDGLIGTWAVVSVQVNGQTVPPEATKDFLFIFTAEKMTRKRGGRVESEAGYRLDPSHTPKWMDALGPEGEKEKPKAVPFLYERDGDTLKLCARTDYKKPGQPGGALKRPAKLDGGAGSEQVLLVLKRQKP